MIILSSRWKCGKKLISTRGDTPPGDDCQLVSVNVLVSLAVPRHLLFEVERVMTENFKVDVAREWIIYLPGLPAVRFIPSKGIIVMGKPDAVKVAIEVVCRAIESVVQHACKTDS